MDKLQIASDFQSQPEKYWDRLFAPSSCLAVITTASRSGVVNAAAFGTCTRVHHNPVYITFTTSIGNDTAVNVLESGEFVANLPPFDEKVLEKVMVVGLPFAPDVDEVEAAGFTAFNAVKVRPPRLAECPRHFECKVEWTREWADGRLMVCGRLVAASVRADCVDDKGYLIWDRVKPAHYCGAPYRNMFVAAYETLSAAIPYKGPEVAKFEAYRRAMFEDM
jgi:flavin reductase (DIM6/NTAB) family NADH-FMN oxidoreductase RutF